MLIAVIPTMKKGRVDALLNQISECSVKPDAVYIMNNSMEPCYLPNTSTFFEIRFPKNIGVNAAWNMAIGMAKSIGSDVSILNDDIVLNDSDFFNRIINSLDYSLKTGAGIICPNTDSGTGFHGSVNGSITYTAMSKREGWAFTIREDLLKILPPIPKELMIFFGDDWIWYHSHSRGYTWIKDLTNKISHQVGSSLRENPDLRRKLEYERNSYRAIMGKKISDYCSE